MKWSSNAFITCMLCIALLPACAKKEMIKPTQETSPAAGATAPREKTAAGKEEATQESIKESTVREEAGDSAGMTGKAAIERRLETVYFDFDSHILAPSARDILYRNSRWLSSNPGVKVQIEGHCDERGSGEYNLALGEKRAKAAMQYLLTLGVPQSRLSFISYGEEKPANEGHDEGAWRDNRRAEFVVVAE